MKSRQHLMGGVWEGFLEGVAHYLGFTGQLQLLQGMEERGGPIGMLVLSLSIPWFHLCLQS